MVSRHSNQSNLCCFNYHYINMYICLHLILGCPTSGHSRNYCCRGVGPPCITTSCTTFIPSCPSGYKELDRDKVSCPGSQSKNVCCRPGHGPQCYTSSCTKFIPSCPSPCRERQRLRGSAADCPESGMSRNVCCL